LSAITTDDVPAAPDTEPRELDALAPQADPQSPDSPAAPADPAPSFTERPMIPVELLTAHPGNVREDRQANQAFCQSVAAVGILVPLEITTTAEGTGYRVVDGNIRLDAAIKTGLTAVPYTFSPDTADAEGLQYLHMLITSRYRRSLSVYEEAAALFSASEAGLTRTQIRKTTGLKAAEVRAGIAAGGLSPKARDAAEQADYEWDLEELALLRPFEDDAEAMEQITSSLAYGRNVRYVVQRLTDEREAAARRQQITDALRTAGVTVVDELPAGAVPLHRLLASAPDTDQPDGSEDGDQDHDPDTTDADAGPAELDPDSHASCPGAIAYLSRYHDEPAYYCLNPSQYGHADRYSARSATLSLRPDGGGDIPVPGDPRGDDREGGTDRAIVIEGNKAWTAAGTVRQRWLAEYLTRKTPPRDDTPVIARFVTTRLLSMPEPLCRALGGIRHGQIFRAIGAPTADAAEAAPQPKLWLLALAPIAAAYEDQITGSGPERDTWRTDRYSPCPRTQAGQWLAFTAELGHQLTPIEQAVADSVPYRGDAPAGQPDAASDGEPGGPEGPGDAPDLPDPDDDPAPEQADTFGTTETAAA
jgi:ParB family transcriptional regulator, chromosome partitioning protein